jgi:hypothetical protein
MDQARASLKKLDTIPPSHHERLIMVGVLDLTSQLAALKSELSDYRKQDADERRERQRATDRYRDYVEAQVRRLWMSVAANATATIAAWLFGRRALLVRGAPLPPLWKWLASAYVFVGVGLVWHFRTKYGLWPKS